MDIEGFLNSFPAPINSGQSRRLEIIKKVVEAVCINRMNSYGDAEDNFKDIADFWNIYLGNKTRFKLSSQDVASMMALVKLSRIKSSVDSIDSWVDLAGYGVCGAGITLNK